MFAIISSFASGMLRKVLPATLLGALLIAAVSCGSAHRTVPATPVASGTVVPSAASTAAAPPISTSTVSAASIDWPTYHGDLARTGAFEGPSWSGVQRAWQSIALDGDVYAEPLVVNGRVVVATENNTVYALDAASGSTLWHVSLGAPVPRSQLPCGDIDPTGITGTPAADAVTGTVYVVTFTAGRHELVGLNVKDGAIRFRRAIDPPAANPLVQQQRAALALANGKVYVAFGGLFGDCGDYHGWVVASNADGSGDLLSYEVAAGRAAGIWAPSGPAVDASGALFVATGNSDATSSPDEGDTVIKLSPTLQRLDTFTPSDWAAHNARDLDLGTVGPALLEGGLLFQIGKPGIGYVLRADHLGGIGGELASAQICNSAYGGTASQASAVYVSCRDGVVAVDIDPVKPALNIAWRGPRFNAGPPIVAHGLVWTLDLTAGELFGLDPQTGATRVRQSLGSVAHFTTPATDATRLYVAADRHLVALSAAAIP
jgi:outer membrane protein assembly factor BamB